MATQAGTIATEPVRVDVRSVEKEISNLWRRAAEGAVPGISGPMTRILQLNLLVYAPSDAEADEATRVITELAAEHPARSVIADAQPGEPGHELDADVSMFCSVSERGRRLCGEEIRLHAHGIAAAALGTIMPILAPGLPIYLWTTGDFPMDDQILSQLAHISDHWIVDSRRFSDWTKHFERVISLGPGHEPPIMAHDLAWTALSDWREAVAQHFDPIPARNYLPGVSRVAIVYGQPDGPKPHAEALLLAAWLVSKLGWTDLDVVRTDSRWSLRAKSGWREVTIDLIPHTDRPTPLISVTIEAETNGRRAVFGSTKAERAEEIHIETQAPDLPGFRRTIHVPPASLMRNVCEVLDDPGSDRLYEKVLPTIRELALKIEGKL